LSFFTVVVFFDFNATVLLLLLDFGLQDPDHLISVFLLQKELLFLEAHLTVISVDELKQLLILDVVVQKLT
jgi:hypothetical protein